MSEEEMNNNMNKVKNNFDEAVLTYSNGKIIESTYIVLATIVENAKILKDKSASKEQIAFSTSIAKERKNWLLALDMLQASKEKDKFETFSLYYADYFKLTAPVYNESVFNNDNYDQGSRTTLNIDIKISDINNSKIAYFESSAIENKSCLIDFSRSSIEPENPETLKKLFVLRKSLIKIRKSGATAVIMGENDFLFKLNKIIKSIEVEFADKEDSIPKIEKLYWLFTCELYQWLGKKEEFEELSLQYSRLFKITPPSYEDDQIMNIQNINKNEDSIYLDQKKNKINLPNEITTVEIDKLIKIIKNQIDKIRISNDEIIKPIILDFNNVLRFDFNSSTKLSAFLNKEYEDNEESENNNLNKNKIIIKNPFEFIIRLFDMTGVSNYVTFNERNRYLGG